MKIAPLYRAFQNHKNAYSVKLIHTGQHYDQNMSGVFLEQLGLPKPDYHLNIGSGSHAFQTGTTMIEYEKLCLESSRPDLVIVVGDVNATIACTLAAKKIGVHVAHLEAGLRSFDREMPEEINRILTDSISDILWTPSPDGDEQLIKENIAQNKITRVGNIMIDSLVMMMPQIEQSTIMDTLDIHNKKFAVATLHRPSNVDDPQKFKTILNTIRTIDIPLIMPVHPRTQKIFDQLPDPDIPENIRMVAPLPYIDFMKIVKNAEFILTDSGGIQEETTYLNIPCFTMRDNTERPITIDQGTNILVSPETLIDHIHNRKSGSKPDLWDGDTANRIIHDLQERGYV